MIKDLFLIIIAVCAVLIFINQTFPGSQFDIAGQLLEREQAEQAEEPAAE